MLVIYKLCLTACTIILVLQGFSLITGLLNKSKKDVSGQQRPPLPVNPDEDCHIINALPLLPKKHYQASGYKLIKLKTKPLIIEETIRADKFLNLKIQQRGCEDVYAKFNFTFKAKKNQGIKRNLRNSAKVLKKLKIKPSALLSSKTVLKIAEIVLKESKKAVPFKDDTICLSQSRSECLTDVSFKYEYPHLQLFYVDRP